MPSATGQNWEKYQKKFADDEEEEKKIIPLSEECVIPLLSYCGDGWMDGLANDGNRDIQVLKTYGAAPYAAPLKKLEKDIKDLQTKVNEKIGIYLTPP